MVEATNNQAREKTGAAPQTATISLPVVGSSAGTVRASRTSRWRAASLIAVHLLILGHIVHWLVTGRTLSPVEPSEAMYTLNHGEVNAGFVFFVAALAATLLLGRFVCGWGCHVVAYQDLCAWLLKKMRIKPKAFRSRLLVFAPLALALYMFVWPTVYRWWAGIPFPPLTNHMMKSEFWETFPGPVIVVLTILVCGFVSVYFLGSKGFCTYACPYGGFFSLADKVAPGRILVTDACQHCGHCTATCTSNVRIHEEVALYGMVVDPGCMKCMDCVSVCPNNALYFGFAKPSLVARAKVARFEAPTAEVMGHPAKPSLVAKTPMRLPLIKRHPPPVSPLDKGGRRGVQKVAYDFALWEELLMVVVGVAALVTFRGLYGRIPLLFAAAVAGITAYLFAKSLRLACTSNVRLQNLQLKRGGRLTRAGLTFALTTGVFFVFTAHSAAVQYQAWRGETLLRSLAMGDEVWFAGNDWWGDATPEQRVCAAAASAKLEWVDRWGLLPSASAMTNLVWLYLAGGHDEEAELLLRRLVDITPDQAEPYRGLASVLRKTGRVQEAEKLYRQALAIDPSFAAARNDLAAMHYNVGMSLLDQRHTEEAVRYLRQAAELSPEVALYHYNLGVATFMAGRPAEALPDIREAIRLNPDDPDAHGFLTVVLRELGDTPGAQERRSGR